jgi:hypothetical protein
MPLGEQRREQVEQRHTFPLVRVTAAGSYQQWRSGGVVYMLSVHFARVFIPEGHVKSTESDGSNPCIDAGLYSRVCLHEM